MAKPHIFEPLLRGGERHCRLVNRTKGIVLAETVETAFDSRARRTGLLGRDGLAADAVLAIAPSNAVHTMGMRFPIDVVFITRAGRVTKRALRLRPMRITASLSAFAVLEFAAGHPGVAATSVGDLVAVEAGSEGLRPSDSPTPSLEGAPEGSAPAGVPVARPAVMRLRNAYKIRVADRMSG